MVPNTVVAYQHADLVHVPIRYEQGAVQQLYYDLSRKMYGGYQNLTYNLGRIEMATAYSQGGSSRFQLLPDRFRIIEQNSGIPFEDFKARFEMAMASAANVFGVHEFPLQNVKLRVLSRPVLWDNAIGFLAQKICGFDEEDLSEFGRSPSAFTMSFTFLGTAEENSTYTVKVEAHDQPQQNVALDVEALFGDRLSVDELAKAAENIQNAFAFVSERTMAFLNRHDPQPEQG